MTDLIYPLVAVGTSDATNFFYQLITNPLNGAHIVPSPLALHIDSTLYAPGNSYIFVIEVQDQGQPQPYPSANFNVTLTMYSAFDVNTPSTYKIWNEDMSVMVDSSLPENLFVAEYIPITSNLTGGAVTYSLNSATPTTLINAAVTTYSGPSRPDLLPGAPALVFTPTQYGVFSVSLRATMDGIHYADKTFKVEVTPSHLWKLVDGQIELDYVGDNYPGNYYITCQVEDSKHNVITTQSPAITVKPQSYFGIQVPTDHLRYWTDEDVSSTPGTVVTLPVTGSLPNTIPNIQTPVNVPFDNGLIATLQNVGGMNEVVINPPANTSGYTSKNSEAHLQIPLTNAYGSIGTTIRTMVINTTALGLDPATYPFEVDIYPSSCRINKEFFSLNPLKPYPNSPDITRKAGLTATVRSGYALPLGLSLDSVTGLIYGIPRAEADDPNIFVPIDFSDPFGRLVGSANIHFDLVPCFALLQDQAETPANSRTLIAGTVGVAPLDFAINAITRYDMSWTEEGVNPVATAAVPTTVSLSSFAIAGNNQTITVSSVSDVFTPAGVFVSSTLHTPEILATATAVTGQIVTQTFLRSAIGSINKLTSFVIDSGHVPDGLAVQICNRRVLVTGIPSEFGEFDLTVMAIDVLGNMSHWILSRDKGTALEVPFFAPLKITTDALPTFNATSAVSFQMQARGGTPSSIGTYANWSVAIDTPLPAGILLDSTGLLHCDTGLVVAAPATYITFVVTDTLGLGVTKTLTLSYDNTLRITTTSIPNFSVTVDSDFQLVATGGAGASHYVWTESGALPAGFSLASNGIIHHIAPNITSSPSPITWIVNDGVNPGASASLSISSQPTSAATFTFVNSLDPIKRGWAYSGYIKVSGGVAPYVWDIAHLNLPNGFTATPTVGTDQINITGVTNDTGPVSLVVKVYDAALASNEASPLLLSVPIVSGLSFITTTLPQVRAGSPYKYYGDPTFFGGIDVGDDVVMQISAPNFASCQFSSSISSVFTNLSINQTTGIISGTYPALSPSVTTPTAVTFTVGNGVDTITQTIYMTAANSSLAISTIAVTPTPIPSGTFWNSVPSLTATGGVAPYTWTSTQILPVVPPAIPGLHIVPQNYIDQGGNPVAGGTLYTDQNGIQGITGTYPFSVQVTDAVGTVAAKGYHLTIGVPETIIPGPDFANSTSLNYIGYIAATNPGNTVTINSQPSSASSEAFKLIMKDTIATTAPIVTVSVSDPLDPDINILVGNISAPVAGVTTIPLTNFPVNTLGDHTFGLNVVDGPNSFSTTARYKTMRKRNVTVTQTDVGNSLLPITASKYTVKVLEQRGWALNVNDVTFETYNGQIPTSQTALDLGAIKINNKSSYASGLSLAVPSGGVGMTLVYNGSTWPSGVADFPLEIVYSDVAWFNYANTSMDLFVPTNLSSPSGLTTDVYRGGAGVTINVQPLVWPSISLISPSQFPADTVTHSITLQLATPLHRTQNPTISVTLPLGLTLDTPPVANIVNNQITGWTFTAHANVPNSGSVLVSLNETLTYLKNGVVTTENVIYQTSLSAGTLTATLIAPSPWYVGSFPAPKAGVDGWTGQATVGGVSYAGYAGRITFTAKVYSNLSNSFFKAELVGKLASIGVQTTIAVMSPVGVPTWDSALSLWYQMYTCTVDTGGTSGFFALAGTDNYCNLGCVATTTANTTNLSSNIWSTVEFLNRNLVSSFTNWSITTTTTNENAGTSYSYFNTGFNTSSTGWTKTPGNVQTNEGVADVGGYITLLDSYGQATVSDPNLEYLSKVEISTNGGSSYTQVSLVRASGSGINPLSINHGLAVGVYPAVKFRLTPKSTYSAALVTPALQIEVKYTSTLPCFSGSTYVYTSSGPKRIDAMQEGKYVLTISEEDFKAGKATMLPYPVETVLIHEGSFKMVAINGVKSTLEHPWASEGGFVDASELTSCVNVLPTASKMASFPITKEATDSENVVYNLHIGGANTYLVANNVFGPWYLVHNIKEQ